MRLGYVWSVYVMTLVLLSVTLCGAHTSFLSFLFNQIHKHTHTCSPFIIMPMGLFPLISCSCKSSLILLTKAVWFKDVDDYRLRNNLWRTCIALDPSADSYCDLIIKSQECAVVTPAYFMLAIFSHL